MLELKNLKKYYKLKNGDLNEVLKGITLKFDNKGMTFILGKSGSGKTTLLNLLGGLDKITRGDILVDGKSMNAFTENDYNLYRNNYVGFIFQDYNNIEEYTVLENILLGCDIQNKKVDMVVLDNLLKKLDIYHLKKRKINELSGGEQERVAIARALLRNSKMILADEPTGNLDSTNGKNIMDILKEISKDRLVIVVTHDIEFARAYADRIVEIKDGVIINDTGNLDGVKEDNLKLKASRIPLKDIFKLSFLSLKNKKGRFLITSILIAFAMFFLSFSYIINTYDKSKTYYKLLKKDNITNIEIKKIVDGIEYRLSSDDIKTIKNSISSNIDEIYNLTEEDLATTLNLKYSDDSIFYQTDYKLDIIANTKIKNKLIGNYPNNSDEVIISNYLADLLIKFGTIDNYKPKDYQEIINDNKKIKLGKYNYIKIVGIIDYDLSKYDTLKKTKEVNEQNQSLYEELNKDILYKYNKMYVNSDFINKLILPKDTKLDNNNQYIMRLLNGYPITNIDILNKKIEYYDGKTYKTTNKLKDGEVILNLNSLIKDKDLLNQNLKKYQNNPKDFIVNYLNLNNYIDNNVKLNIYENSPEIYSIKVENPSKTINNLKIIGITGFDLEDKTTYVATNKLDNYIDDYVKIKGVMSDMNYHNIANITKNNAFNILNKYTDTINSYYEEINQFKTFFLILTVIFLIFSCLLIYNFMINNIDNKKRDIGILKSLGANSYNIIEIFLLENILLSIIATIITCILIIIVISIINNLAVIPFIYIESKIIYILIFYPLILTILSSIIPIKKLLKKQVVDLIYRTESI